MHDLSATPSPIDSDPLLGVAEAIPNSPESNHIFSDFIYWSKRNNGHYHSGAKLSMQLHSETLSGMSEYFEQATNLNEHVGPEIAAINGSKLPNNFAAFFELSLLSRTLESVAESMPHPIFITNEIGLIIAANQAARELTSHCSAGLIGKKIGEILVFSYELGSRRYADLLQYALDHELDDHRPGVVVTNFQEKNHSIDFSITPLRDEASNLIGGILIGRHFD